MVMDHGRVGPPGIDGGAAGAVNTVTVHRGEAVYVPPHRSKDQGIRIGAGDSITVETPGGGDCGDALQRDPALIARDVARGYYTQEQAKALFSGG